MASQSSIYPLKKGIIDINNLTNAYFASYADLLYFYGEDLSSIRPEDYGFFEIYNFLFGLKIC